MFETWPFWPGLGKRHSPIAIVPVPARPDGRAVPWPLPRHDVLAQPGPSPSNIYFGNPKSITHIQLSHPHALSRCRTHASCLRCRTLSHRSLIHPATLIRPLWCLSHLQAPMVPIPSTSIIGGERGIQQRRFSTPQTRAVATLTRLALVLLSSTNTGGNGAAPG